MLRILFIESRADIGEKVRDIIARSEFTVCKSLDCRNHMTILAAIEQERPDTIVFCANDRGDDLYLDAEILQEIRAGGYTAQILFVGCEHNREVSRIALEFNVEWVIAMDTEGELLIRALQRMDQKQRLIHRARLERMQRLFMDFINDDQGIASEDQTMLFRSYLRGPWYQVAVVRILPPHRKRDGLDRNNLISLKGYEMLENRLSNLREYIAVKSGLDILVCLTGTPEDLEEAKWQLIRYLKDIEEFDLTISRSAAWVCMGRPVERIQDIKKSCHEAFELTYERILLTRNELIELRKMPKESVGEKKESFEIFDVRKVLVNSLETFEDMAIHKVLVQLKSNLRSMVDFSGRELYDIYKALVSSLYQELEKKIVLTEMPTDYGMALREYAYFWNMDEVFVYLEELFLEGIEVLKRQEENSVDVPVLLAKRYIRSYFNMPLTLKELSEYVGMNENYFSDYFKKCTQMTFKQYQTNLRIRYSKQMLLDKQYTMEDIADAVGYNDVKYFSRVFKQNCGIAPGEYRKKYHVMKD